MSSKCSPFVEAYTREGAEPGFGGGKTRGVSSQHPLFWLCKLWNSKIIVPQRKKHLNNLLLKLHHINFTTKTKNNKTRNKPDTEIYKNNLLKISAFVVFAHPLMSSNNWLGLQVNCKISTKIRICLKQQSLFPTTPPTPTSQKFNW